MLKYLKNSKMVITDSGGLQKESFFAKKKCIVLRNETEWTELKNSTFLCKPRNLFEMYKNALTNDFDNLLKPYGDGRSSKIILESILKFFS